MELVLCSVGMVVTNCPSMQMPEQLLPCLKISLLPVFQLLRTLVGSSQYTALHCHHFSLFLLFPTHLFNVYTFLQAQPLVRLLMHTSLFPTVTPSLFLIHFLALFFFYNWSVWGTAYPVLLEVAHKNTCPFLSCFFFFWRKGLGYFWGQEYEESAWK